MDNDKNKIIQKAINGDREAIIDLIKSESNNIYSTLYYLKKNKDEINDLAQDVLFKLSNKIHQLKNPQYFKTWLNRLIINTYYDYIRKSKKPFEIISSDNNDKFDITDYKNNPQDSVLYSELDKIIKFSIENLPIQYKIPLTLREIQGLSYSDISNITKTSIGTVKSRISRARNIIKDKIKRYAYE